MMEDGPIDLNTENTKLNNELIVLRAKYNELDEDRHYVKSLLDAEFEKRKKLEKENEKLKKGFAKCELVANHRGEMVGFANSLIRDFCDNKEIEMWEKFKEEKWEEYKYKTDFSQNKRVERMTDKRFTLTTTEFDGTLSFYDGIYDCETRMSTEYVLNAVETTLNQLADENEQLKNRFKQIHENNDYTCTIKQLQDKIDAKETLLKQYEKEYDKLKQENEELKKKIKIMGDAFTKFEEVFYLKVYEPSEHYDEKFLCSLSNAILGDDEQ